ncbi:serine protease [Streptomyces sp. NBC_01481]|uniref:trypsin-like serine peptidase n=1 Tax=Streptomyces sp. NBC_01481 TaxID=2975869 RepID=UPI0022505D13|nr:trypsin-like serine protease [Streptomyces sp. NBC_01481]MCX4581972.1 S1 family peptidase [Streptomyces sp. NBC_01481]
MADAVPVDSASGTSRAGAAAPGGIRKGDYFGGLPMVGTFFYDGRPLGGEVTSCTGSVVHSATKDLVLTAGHCANGLKRSMHSVFVPQYRHGAPAAGQPSGIFEVRRVFVDPRYEQNTTKPVSDLDFAFVRLAPNSRGRAEDVTGSLTLTRAAGYRHNATVIGYPSGEDVNKKHQALRCDVTTSRLTGFRQMRMTCAGFHGGVSGGPGSRTTTRRPAPARSSATQAATTAEATTRTSTGSPTRRCTPRTRRLCTPTRWRKGATRTSSAFRTGAEPRVQPPAVRHAGGSGSTPVRASSPYQYALDLGVRASVS